MDKNDKKGLERLVVLKAKTWRELDKDAIADKHDTDKQQAEYRARRDLGKTIDDAGRHS